MSHRVCVASLAIVLFTVGAITGHDGRDRCHASDPFNESLGPAFRQHCADCHGSEEDPEGDLNLLAYSSEKSLVSQPELLRDLIDVLESKAMPPEDGPELADAERRVMVSRLRVMLEQSIRLPRDFPVTPIRRMNRFQYHNAVEDLFALKVEVFALPERMLREYGYFDPQSRSMPETLKAGSRPLGKSQLIGKRLAGVAPFPQDLRAEHGFDNRGDHLSLSPLLMESFLKLSRSIVDSEDFNRKTCGIWDEFFAPPRDEQSIDREIAARLEPFLTRAFRRPVGVETLDRYVRHTRRQVENGTPFTDAMKGAASAALASPRFLYLYDGKPDGDRARGLDDLQLASRLSFFLWASIPDQRLINLATKGELRDPDVLASEVERMLDDKKVKRFCDSFPSQWLQLERIISSVPDPQKFPEFYFAKFRVSMHMMLEPLLLFETVLVEDRPILELIDSDFSYRSDLLESWYRTGGRGSKTPPTAIPFRRVQVNDRKQGGVITNAAVMTMTSGSLRTQPITRGAWVAAVIFNDPPEPPPADVPPFPETDTGDDQNLTLRERFAAHRDQAQCAGCHTKIDPLGFALENYGPTGVWRDHYDNGRQVDSSGVLFGRREFAGAVEFKESILAEKQRFARAFASHLLSFAIGRQVSPADWPTLDQIAGQAAASDYRIRPLIAQIVLSDSFLGASQADASE